MNLTPAELERLAILSEEMGEAIQVIGKILRHGYHGEDFTGIKYENRTDLELELGDVRAAMIRLCNAGDVRKDVIHGRADRKLNGGTMLRFQRD